LVVAARLAIVDLQNVFCYCFQRWQVFQKYACWASWCSFLWHAINTKITM